MGTINSLSSFNADTQQAGVLLGDVTLRGIDGQIRQILGRQVGNGTLRSLVDLGITTERDGTLLVDDTKLQGALDGTPAPSEPVK